VIQRVDIANFRCLRQTSITLEPLTVLVGPNGSGKSAALAALNPRLGFAELDVWQHRSDLAVQLAYQSSGGGAHRVEKLSGRGPTISGALIEFKYQLLRLDLNSLRAANMLQFESHLRTNGGNLPNVIGSLSRSQQGELARSLCSLVPLFADVGLVPVSQGQQQLRFQDRWNSSVWYSPNEVSDGTMLLLAYLTLQYQSPPVDLVAIEEPERGLHPYLLDQLLNLLRKLSRGEIGGRPVQVVLATHSPELLEFVKPEEVRFLNRNADDGSVVVNSIPVGDPDWPRYFREYSESLKQAWLSGGLGGVPGSEPRQGG
jgi:predicted ATPase